MENQQLNEGFRELSTPLMSDACLRLGLPLRIAPAGIQPLIAGSKIAGRALPARHYGSVDIFLEAMGMAEKGDILVIDNGGRMDEGSIGDLTALESRISGLAAIVVWGCHRDSFDLERIGFPVFSYGRFPAGPRRVDQREPDALNSAHFGDFMVFREDLVFADADGVLFAPAVKVEEILSTARAIWMKERGQAEEIIAGKALRTQLRFDEYLARRAHDPDFSFRRHLRNIGGAIEE
jgi:regulator of RNase E activity RraA